VIGYIGISFHTEIAKAELGTATLKSYSGDFLLRTPQSIAAAAASLGPRTSASRSLTHWVPTPIRWSTTNTRSLIQQANPEIAKAIKRFLLWAIGHRAALAAHIWVLSHDQIEMKK
jgi:phosphate transport system substrate-binding protein